jgi:hypothetical protein
MCTETLYNQYSNHIVDIKDAILKLDKYFDEYKQQKTLDVDIKELENTIQCTICNCIKFKSCFLKGHSQCTDCRSLYKRQNT